MHVEQADMVGMWSVCGFYAVGMWWICGRHVVGMGWLKVVSIWSIGEVMLFTITVSMYAWPVPLKCMDGPMD